MDSKTIRRQNVRNLAAKDKNLADFARKLGVTASYLNQIIGPNPSRGIGDAQARRIEKILGLPGGYLDAAHDVNGLDQARLLATVSAVEAAIVNQKAKISPEKRAQLYLAVYRKSEEIDRVDIELMVSLAAQN